MADYSFNPQFANLTGLQPLPAIDVTRGGALQFQALQPIQVVSSRPELVAEGIAGAVSNIAKGALSGITAKWEKQEEEAKEKRKYAHELMLYGAKEKLENADYFSKKEAEFIAENSGKPGFAKKYSEFKKAYSRFNEATPEVSSKEDYDTTAEVTLPQDQPDLKADFLTTSPDIPEERPGVFGWKQPTRQALSAIPVYTAAEPSTASLENLPQPQVPPSVVTTEQKPLAGVDYTKYEQPPTPTNQFETDAEAQNFADTLNKKLRQVNPDWIYEVTNLGKQDEWKTIKPVSIRKDRLSEEQTIKKEIVEGQREERKVSIEQEKLDIAKAKEEREAKESEQQMAIRQQKVKDENKVLADHIETAATSLKELNDIISIIEKNPYSVGAISSTVSMLPYNSDARRVRAKLETIQGGVAINALTAMRQASPTGAAVGNTSDKDMNLFKATEGTLDPDRATAEDILPVLKDIYRKRLDIYNNSSKILKENNPEYAPPSISYPKPSKKKETTKAEKVSVISPDGKVGSIPKSQLEEAISKGYKLQ